MVVARVALTLLLAACQGTEPTTIPAHTSAPPPAMSLTTVRTSTPQPSPTSAPTRRPLRTIELTPSPSPGENPHPTGPATSAPVPASTPLPPTPPPSPVPAATATVAPVPTSTPLPPTQILHPTPAITPVPPPSPVTSSNPCASPTRTVTPGSIPGPGPGNQYEGPLFDTHAHGGPQNDSLDVLFNMMNRHQVEWMMMYLGASPEASLSGKHYSRIRDYIEGARCRIVFLLAHGSGQAFAQGLYVEKFLKERLQPQGPFQGVGEIRLYLSPLQPISYAGPQMQAVFRSVNEMGGIVMIHPRDRTRDSVWRPEDSTEVAKVLQEYPNITFLFHGHPTTLERHILPLMSEYSNVYFTFDVAHMVHTNPARISARDPNRPDYRSPEYADWWVTHVNDIGVDNIVKDSVHRTRIWFLRHPDRIVWGTDRVRYQWEAEPSDLAIRLSRKFIAQLPEEVQEEYAYKNALRVFGRYFVPPQ